VTGLLEHPRDLTLPARAGEPALAPPDAAQFAAEVLPRLLPGLAAADATRCELVYARWKPGVATTAAYRVEHAGATHHAVWRVHAGGKWSAADARAIGRGRFGDDARDLVLDVDERRGRLAFLFPADPDLPGAVRAFDVGRFARWFEGTPIRPGRRVRRKHVLFDLVRYRPASRAVLHARVKLEDQVGAKERIELGTRVLAGDRAAGVLARRRAFEGAIGSSGPFPRLLGGEERVGLVHEEWLDVAVRASSDHSDAVRVFAALARLHRLPLAHGAGLERAPAGDETRAWFAPWPQLASHASPAPRLEASAWTHGDFNPDCIAIERATGALRLLDADSLAIGDPCVDVAEFVAGALDARSCGLGQVLADFESGYDLAQRATPAELVPHVARALERRAAAALRRLEVGALEHAEALLERARRLHAEVRS
jgi:hypothetical protein